MIIMLEVKWGNVYLVFARFLEESSLKKGVQHAYEKNTFLTKFTTQHSRHRDDYIDHRDLPTSMLPIPYLWYNVYRLYSIGHILGDFFPVVICWVLRTEVLLLQMGLWFSFKRSSLALCNSRCWWVLKNVFGFGSSLFPRHDCRHVSKTRKYSFIWQLYVED